MISDELLKCLRCPQTAQPLTLAEPELVARLNELVEQGKLRNREGETVTRRLEQGLIAEQAGVVYPVANDIPDLVSSDGIPLDQLPASG
ncbi:MAG: hypothetical protein RIC55_26730 [Pirellulaceae bacterium]